MICRQDLERVRLGHGFIAEHAEDPRRARASFDAQEIELEEREGRKLLPRLLADDDWEMIDLRLAFKARGEIHIIAQNRIVKALLRPEIADAARAGRNADADADRREGPSRHLRLIAPFRVERD